MSSSPSLLNAEQCPFGTCRLASHPIAVRDLFSISEGGQRSQATAGKDKTEEQGSGLGQGFPVSRG